MLYWDPLGREPDPDNTGAEHQVTMVNESSSSSENSPTGCRIIPESRAAAAAKVIPFRRLRPGQDPMIPPRARSGDSPQTL